MIYQIAIGFSFASDWLRGWRKFLNQSQSEVKQNQSFDFDAQLKIALFTQSYLVFDGENLTKKNVFSLESLCLHVNDFINWVCLQFVLIFHILP